MAILKPPGGRKKRFCTSHRESLRSLVGDPFRPVTVDFLTVDSIRSRRSRLQSHFRILTKGSRRTAAGWTCLVSDVSLFFPSAPPGGRESRGRGENRPFWGLRGPGKTDSVVRLRSLVGDPFRPVTVDFLTVYPIRSRWSRPQKHFTILTDGSRRTAAGWTWRKTGKTTPSGHRADCNLGALADQGNQTKDFFTYFPRRAW